MSQFPVTATDKVVPSHPADEPSREEVNRRPEGLLARMQRTRRYFRLTHMTRKLVYARGLDSRPDDFA